MNESSNKLIVRFGHAMEDNPNGTWQCITLEPKVYLMEADYCGFIKLYGKGLSYLVAKINSGEFSGGNKNLVGYSVGDFVVRPAFVDMYGDFSATIFLRQGGDEISSIIETQLNSHPNKSEVASSDDIYDKISSEYWPDYVLEGFAKGSRYQEKFSTTSITPYAFDAKVATLANWKHGSLTGMLRELGELRGEYHQK